MNTNNIQLLDRKDNEPMKYCILICDGMADYPIESLGNRTPMETARKTYMDMLARYSIAGIVSNIPDGMVPESDTANLAILSYDPAVYSKGRSPLEAIAMGLDMSPDETAIRCNLVTLSDDISVYDERFMIDHSSDEITTDEASDLIDSLNVGIGNENIRFYTGVSYRHCLLWKDAPSLCGFMRPHDILGQKIDQYLPPEPYLTLQKESVKILSRHPVNKSRRERGLKPANSIWLWSPGKKPSLPSFKDKWQLNATAVSAVDLIKGICLCAGMQVVNVDGATGNLHTNYEGKAEAAIDAFKNGSDLVYIHVEAPDECGHRAETENKVKSIEYIDSRILGSVYQYLNSCGEPFKIMVLPDHPTPVSVRTHTCDPVPFFIYSSDEKNTGIDRFTEKICGCTGLYIEHGYNLLEYFIKNQAKGRCIVS